jgi:TonB family protein
VALKGINMNDLKLRHRFLNIGASRLRLAGLVGSLVLASTLGLAAVAQETPAGTGTGTPPATTPADAAQQPAAAPDASKSATPAPGSAAQEAAPQPAAPDQAAEKPSAAVEAQAPLTVPGGKSSAEITEEQLKQMLVGKDLFLRGGYLGDTISFNQNGMLNGHAPSGSYTLCSVEIDKVHLSKHKLELEGSRYGLHFLGALPYEDPTKAVDRVRITPNKKELRLTIDRETVVKAKKEKEPKAGKAGADARVRGADEPKAMSDEDRMKAEAAAAAASGEATDKGDAPTTTSQETANGTLVAALNNVFAPGIDERMTAHMPKFWKLYYQAVEAKSDYVPADAAVMRQTNVDEKAKLLSQFEPESNEYAQAAAVAGMALYHVVVGADGKPGEIAVARPIGFGLDENAVESIRKASFSPAKKDGKPVPVLLDLVVQFRIYSKRTSVQGTPETAEEAAERKAPGPYTVQQK